MKKRVFALLLVACALMLTFIGLTSCTDDGTVPTNSTTAAPQKLEAPVVTLSGNVASWAANEQADKFEISLDGTLSYVENTLTSKILSNGQTIKVRAVGDGIDFKTSDWSNSVTYTENALPPDNQPTKLSTPVVSISSTGLASWSVVPNAVSYIYKINGGTEIATGVTAVQLTNGQSIVVKAVGDGTTYLDSDYSTSITYTEGSVTPPPPVSGSEPTYLGILASKDMPSASGGVPSAIVPRAARYISPLNARIMSSREYRDIYTALGELFANSDNHLGTTYPVKSEYDVYATPGETVYIQIWLDNPSQYTILSLMLNGTKYQVGGGLSSFFIEKEGKHYNCVYVALPIPSGARTEQEYVVTNIEYIADTYINADGTDQFMNENDTVTVGLPYGTRPSSASFAEFSVSTDGFGFSFDVIDSDGVASNSGSWLGVCVYDGYNVVFNSLATVGSNSFEVSDLAEDTGYEVIVYLYGDLHNGEGVKIHSLASYYIATKSAVDYFEVEAGYYQHWGNPEFGEEADSGLSINVSLYLTSNTATYDRLELYKGNELVYTDNDFRYSTAVEDLLADTTYLVRVYFSDTDYSEHYVEEYVTTGKMEKPEMDLQDKYAFLNSAVFTFDYIQNGFLRQAITKNVRVQIYKSGIWQLEYMDWILMLCDDPELYNRTQAAFDEAVANGDWSLASKIDHESLTFLREAKNIINDGELGDFGTDRGAWEEYFNTVCRTFYLDQTDDFFGVDNGAYRAHLIFRDYFYHFGDEAKYKIFAEVDMKDGEGFVTKELNSGSIYNFHRINSEYNSIEFDCEINGMNVKVNPYFRINYEDNRILVVSYEIGLYTNNGTLVDTLYTSKEVNWADFDEEAWIEAYILAMKGEAILPSEEQIIKEFGWRAIFEILLGVDFGFEDDYTGGGADSEVVVRPDGGTAEGGVIVGGGGRGEKNIANQRERQILRDLLAYDYPEDYEYDLKTRMLEAFMCDEYYWDLINGIDDVDAQLEALISGALNSSIDRVISDCESGIQHFLTWFGSEEDEIYIGFKTVIESYLEDTGKMPEVNWAESYRRIMMFEDFYYFYPFGYVEDFEIDIEDGKYPTGEYIIGIKYRYDSYEEGDYEVRFNHYNKLKITGKLPTPTFEISDYGYVENLRADVANFYGYYIEVEIVNAQGEIVYTGRYDDWSMGGESPRLLANWKVRARTVFNEGATSDLYKGDSEWSDYQIFEGMRIDAPNVEYSEEDGAAKWYANRGEVSHFVYVINDGVEITVPRKNGDYSIYLKNGDTLRVKAVPIDEAKNDGYVESLWVEYTCVDTREMLATPTLTITGEGKEAYLEWNEIPGASRYLFEITRANGETYTREEYGTISYGLEAGSTYHIRAISDNGEVRSSAYSNSVTFAPKLANPVLRSATAEMVRWQSGDSYTRGYNYKIGVNGEVQFTNRSMLTFKDIGAGVGDEIYVQAYADGCESSDWVLICTVYE